MAQAGTEHWRRRRDLHVRSDLRRIPDRRAARRPRQRRRTSPSRPGRAGAVLPVCGPSTPRRRTGDVARPFLPRGATGDAALLRLSDLPAGWVAGAVPAAPARIVALVQQLAGCVGAPAEPPPPPSRRRSTARTSPAPTRCSPSRTASRCTPPGAPARAEYAALASAKTPACMNTASPAGAAGRACRRRRRGATTVGTLSPSPPCPPAHCGPRHGPASP